MKGIKMKSFIVCSAGNYGLITVIINAENIETVRTIADKHECCWDGYEIEEIKNYPAGVFLIADNRGIDYLNPERIK